MKIHGPRMPILKLRKPTNVPKMLKRSTTHNVGDRWGKAESQLGRRNYIKCKAKKTNEIIG